MLPLNLPAPLPVAGNHNGKPPTPNSLQIRKQNPEPSSLREQESQDPQVLSLRDLASFWLPIPGNKERVFRIPKVCLSPSPMSVCLADSPFPGQHSGCLSLDSACLLRLLLFSPFLRPVSFFPLFASPPSSPPSANSTLSLLLLLCLHPLSPFCPCLCLPTSGFCSHCPPHQSELLSHALSLISPIISL